MDIIIKAGNFAIIGQALLESLKYKASNQQMNQLVKSSRYNLLSGPKGNNQVIKGKCALKENKQVKTANFKLENAKNIFKMTKRPIRKVIIPIPYMVAKPFWHPQD